MMIITTDEPIKLHFHLRLIYTVSDVTFSPKKMSQIFKYV